MYLSWITGTVFPFCFLASHDFLYCRSYVAKHDSVYFAVVPFAMTLLRFGILGTKYGAVFTGKPRRLHSFEPNTSRRGLVSFANWFAGGGLYLPEINVGQDSIHLYSPI